jgi:hypothetical protein
MFTVLDQVSVPSSAHKPNEDIFGVSGEWAWVIDTSIFPGTQPFMHPQSDATWLARFANERLTALAPHAQDGRDLLRHVMEEARRIYMAKAPPDRHDFVTWPLGAMTLIRQSGGVLDAWTFGDTTGFVRQPGGGTIIVGDAPGLRSSETAAARRLLSESGSSPTAILDEPAFLAWLGERRERTKQAGKIALLSLAPEAAERARHEQVPCPPETLILLASDGFTALIDLYKHVDPSSIVEAAVQRGLAALAAEARHIETMADPDGKLFPRFKLSDDTTAILLRA